MLCCLAAEHHAWAQWEASASAINPLSLRTTKADREIGKLRLDPAFPWSSQVAEHLLSGVDSSSQCTIALNLKTRFFYSLKTVKNGYKPMTGQLTGPLVWGLWLQMVAGPNLSWVRNAALNINSRVGCICVKMFKHGNLYIPGNFVMPNVM